MKQSVIYIGLLIVILFLVSNLTAKEDWPVLKGPYLGQKPPGDISDVFMDGVISTIKNPEMCAAFTIDGREFYFNAKKDGHWAIFFTSEKDGKWTTPKPMAFSSIYTDRDFTISPDGLKIYFGSNRPRKKGKQPQKSLDIFMVRRLNGNTWSKPINLGFPINTDYGENYPSVASNGNLYFFSYRNKGLGGCDIYFSKYVDGQYQPPKNLGTAINSDKHDWDAYIAPDESYIIFSSKDRKDSVGGQDLYISYRKYDGNWTLAKNMGPLVNSPYCEICPGVSLDGKFLFFTSRRRGKADIFWVDARIIEKLKAKYLK